MPDARQHAGGGPARGDAAVPARQPLLRDRPPVRDRMGAVRRRRRRAGRACRRSATTCIDHIAFGYEHARMTRTALEALHDKTGVCRDYAHLAVAFCRCMNIPARYCTGYLGDIGMPPPYGPMDFAAWFEAYLDGRWYTFDAAQQRAAHRPRADRARPRRRRRRDQHARSARTRWRASGCGPTKCRPAAS